MLLFATIVCDPPLGQSTIVPFDCDKVNFTVLIESSQSLSNQPWEAAIWHNQDDPSQWSNLHLIEIEQTSGALAVANRGRSTVYRRYFSGQLSFSKNRSRHFQFTLKYRTKQSAWCWIKDQTGQNDGDICFQTSNIPKHLGDYISNTDSSFAVKDITSDVPDTQLWAITLETSPATEESATNRSLFGVPHRVTRWFALVRLWTPWLAPRHGRTNFSLTEDAIVTSFLREDGIHFVVLAVSGIDNTLTVLKDNGHGGVIVEARNDDSRPTKANVIAAAGYSFESALSACVNLARQTVKGGFDIEDVLQDELESDGAGGKRLKRLKRPLEAPYRTTWMENWIDGLTYCTWNGLGQKLSEKKILNALTTLKEHNINITNLIIDDNWQSLDNPGANQQARGWIDFEANSEGFPNGLAHCVYEARNKHPNIEHVAVWHAILGYWGGISPTGNIAKRYETQKIRKSQNGKPSDGEITVIAARDLERFYDDFYGFLQRCRVDSVKTDAQSFLDMIHDPEDRCNLIQKYQDVWTVSSLKWFSHLAISCMSQLPQIIFHTQLPQDRPRVCVRNSDDFFPNIPSSHTWHVFSNAYTSLFTHHLNVIPDWDMFQTSHEYSSFHGAARCISGGPVYITDEPGAHDLNLIDQMTAISHRGNTIILRPSTLGRTGLSGIYTAYKEERLLKINTFHGVKGTGASILGLFNVSGRAMTELVMLREFSKIDAGQSYIIRAHSTSEISQPMSSEDALPLVSVFMDVRQWEILTAYPIITCCGVDTAPLGLLGKITSAAALVEYSVEKDHSDRVKVSSLLKALGTYGIYISDLASRSIERHLMATINGLPVPLHLVAAKGNVLSIDLALAWKETKQVPSWNNEVAITVLIAQDS